MAVLEVVIRSGEVLSALEVAAAVALFFVACGGTCAIAGEESVVVYPASFDRAGYFAAFLNAFHTDCVFGIFVKG